MQVFLFWRNVSISHRISLSYCFTNFLNETAIQIVEKFHDPHYITVCLNFCLGSNTLPFNYHGSPPHLKYSQLIVANWVYCVGCTLKVDGQEGTEGCISVRNKWQKKKTFLCFYLKQSRSAAPSLWMHRDSLCSILKVTIRCLSSGFPSPTSAASAEQRCFSGMA